MQKVKIVGVGPGNPSCITPEARSAIEGARIVVGGKRHIENFCRSGQIGVILANNLEEILELVKRGQNEGVAVLASGDPGMYGILSFLKSRLGTENIEVIPGVSSVQIAFARLCLPWHEAVVLSAHGRPLEKVAELTEKAGIYAVLTGSDNPPEKVFSLLEKRGSGRKYYFCFDLSLPEEQILSLASGDTFPEEFKGRHNCVMVLENE